MYGAVRPFRFMDTKAWLLKIRSAKKTAMLISGRKKIYFTFPDGVEMARVNVHASYY